MRKAIVAGNWKMNGSKASVKQLVNSILEQMSVSTKVEVIIFPPYVYLDQVSNALKDSQIIWGGQNVSEYQEGAYTGEISASMLKDLHCGYVLLGHSERRSIFHETNRQVADKFVVAAQQGLKPMLCVGETLPERESNRTYEIITNQLEAVFEKTDSVNLWNQAVIAYEPVWAIGTGVSATPEQAQEVHAYIRKFVEKYDKTLAQNLRILYGGSVKSSNAQQLFAMPDIDGGLVGGASLQAEDFLEIIRLCNNYC